MLHRAFDATRKSLLEERMKRWEDLRRGSTLDFLPETRPVREGEWRVASVPKDLQDRRGEAYRPGGTKKMINPHEPSAEGVLGDLLEFLSPTPSYVVLGHA